MPDARPALARLLDLEPHPEGGWYRRTWAAPTSCTRADGEVRPTATLILFLLAAGDSSAWHRVSCDEVWVAHTGRVVLQDGGDGESPVESRLEPVEEGSTSVVVGVDVAVGEHPQVVVPAGRWQRTLPVEHDALVTCLVSPGFDFADLELA